MLATVILSVSPAYAGMDKTDEAWAREVSRVNDGTKSCMLVYANRYIKLYGVRWWGFTRLGG